MSGLVNGQNMYRVGEFVYFETSAMSPYQIRKIEELSKNAAGQVEAKVQCYYRRRDIATPLLMIADQAKRAEKSYEVEEDENEKKEEEEKANGNENGEEKAEVKEVKTEENGAALNGVATKDGFKKKEWGNGGLPIGNEELDESKRHLIRQRELYGSKQIESIPATQIRGHCNVTLLSEVETVESYDKDDVFFYSLIYDAQQCTLLADKGVIKVGKNHQAEVPLTTLADAPKAEVKEESEEKSDELMIAEEDDEKKSKKEAEPEREILVFHPHHILTDREIDQFLIIARAVGTFSRALDTSSSSKLPSLHMTAAAASRDVTLFHAMALLHQANYDIGKAVKFLVPPPSKDHYPLDADKTTNHKTVSLGGPILCRDQIEEWSAAEANLFEEGIEKHGKDFVDIRNEFLPWKSIRDIVEYYYMWKTTNRYAEVKKTKIGESTESKLKQVYIPMHNKTSPNMIGHVNLSGIPIPSNAKNCEGCSTGLALQWFTWGPAYLQMRLCNECWSHWKRFGGLKKRHEYENYDLDGSVIDNVNKTPAIQNNTHNINKNAPKSNVIMNKSPQVVAKMAPNVPLFVQEKFNNTAKNMRPNFSVLTDPQSKIMRRLAGKSGGPLNVRKISRKPFSTIPVAAIKIYCESQPKEEIEKTIASALKLPLGSVIPPAYQQSLTQGTLFASLKRPANGSPMEAPPTKRFAPEKRIDWMNIRNTVPSDCYWQELTGHRLSFRAGPQFKRFRKGLKLNHRFGIRLISRNQKRRLQLPPLFSFLQIPQLPTIPISR